MKSAFKLLVIYFLLLQLVCPIVIFSLLKVYYTIAGSCVSDSELLKLIFLPAQTAAVLLMIIYLWKGHYFNCDKQTWSVVSLQYTLWSVVTFLIAAIWVSELVTWLNLPNVMVGTFDIISASWVGLFILGILGPVMEELLFRGSIQRLLLKNYSPSSSILVSSMLFGLIHLNPAQIVPGFIMGLILGWAYYRSASLLPCILMHVTNNCFSLWLMHAFADVPQADVALYQMLSPLSFVLVLAVSMVLGTIGFCKMRKVKIDYHWQ